MADGVPAHGDREGIVRISLTYAAVTHHPYFHSIIFKLIICLF